jgi:hypothetical protein
MADIEYIPANPPVNSRGIEQIRLINTATRVEVKEKVIIPPPPVAEFVPYIVPERRKFSQPLAEVRDDVFRSRR